MPAGLIMPMRGAVVLALSLTGAAVAATSSLLVGGDQSLERVEETGVIRIGYAVEAPYAMVVRGRVTGHSAELARLVVDRLGIERIEWVQSDFDALLSDLRSGRFDVVAAGMFITPDRARSAAFSEPALRVRTGLLVPRGNPLQLHSLERLAAIPDIRVAAIAGSVEEDRLLATGFPRARVLRVPDAVSGRSAVARGAVDVLVLSEPTTRAMAWTHPDLLESVPSAPDGSSGARAEEWYIGFAFAPDAARLRDAWNDAQADILHGPDHLRVLRKFGFEAADLPGRTSLADVFRRSAGDAAEGSD